MNLLASLGIYRFLLLICLFLFNLATYKRTVDNLWEKYKGIFYRMQGKLLKEREIIKTGLTLGNGLTWSKDRRRFYYIDSYNYNIQVYDFDLENGEISKYIYI